MARDLVRCSEDGKFSLLLSFCWPTQTYSSPHQTSLLGCDAVLNGPSSKELSLFCQLCWHSLIQKAVVGTDGSPSNGKLGSKIIFINSYFNFFIFLVPWCLFQDGALSDNSFLSNIFPLLYICQIFISCQHDYARNDRQPIRNKAGLGSAFFFPFTLPKKGKVLLRGACQCWLWSTNGMLCYVSTESGSYWVHSKVLSHTAVT